jgi:hypothetical protein
MTDQLREAADALRAAREAARCHYLDRSRERLGTIVGKKGRTLLFGLVARFEKAFGRLWGHGKADADCSAEELRWRALWKACRGECLDHGHGQLRALEKELGEYEVEWLRHRARMEACSIGREPNGENDAEQGRVRG